MTNEPVKVLVAEDDNFLMKVYQSKLIKEGFQIIAATDGEMAIEKIEKERPDIVLLDLIMPVKNGFEVLEEINANPELKKIPVLILSNLGQESDIEKGIQLGAVDFIVKSNMSIQGVVDKIRSLT